MLAIGTVLTTAVPVHADGEGDHEGRRLDGGPNVSPATFGRNEAADRGHDRGGDRDHDDLIGERPTLDFHMDQSRIDSRQAGLNEIVSQGQAVFEAQWTKIDGASRPGTTSSGTPRTDAAGHPLRANYDFLRTNGPDSTSCLGCHGQPRSGGAGERNTNLFLGFNGPSLFLDPSGNPSAGAFSTDPQFCNERNPPSLFGDGPLEMASREMSFELQAIRDAAKAAAASSPVPVTRALVAKGISFGSITVNPDGKIDATAIQGVDWDLVVKPFGWKGGLNIRSFEVGGMNLHFGMQPVEKFGLDTDPDGDGVKNELSKGDMTAEVIFTAALGTPGRVFPRSGVRRDAIARGEQIFDHSLCATCHTPKMYLNSPLYSEPSPFNSLSTGLLTTADVSRPFTFDMTREGERPRVEVENGRPVIRAYTDLKRHDITDGDTANDSHFANEQLPGGNLSGLAPATTFANPVTKLSKHAFLTSKLWGIGSSAPYGHRGDLTTLTENIRQHSGEARASRDAYFAMPLQDQMAVVEFLKSLAIVPAGEDREVHDH